MTPRDSGVVGRRSREGRDVVSQVPTGSGVIRPFISLAALGHCPEVQLSQSRSLP